MDWAPSKLYYVSSSYRNHANNATGVGANYVGLDSYFCKKKKWKKRLKRKKGESSESTVVFIV